MGVISLIARERHAPSGFTVVELMVAMVISLLVMSAIFTTFRSQTRSWVVEQETADLQQNLRAGMFRIERAIRMAGFDPQNSNKFGFVSSLPSPFNGSGATTNGNNIAFTLDWDGDQVLDSNNNEIIAFRIDNLNELDILVLQPTIGSWSWQTVAENISSLTFTYLNASGAATTTLADIRAVQITLTAASNSGVTDRTRILTRRIRCRNML